ncbi:MAG: FtsX-like permease family protein [Bacteroidota bacterium]
MWSRSLRSIARNPFYALLNVIGLAVALAACVLIALFVRNELSYDRHHENADRIVVLGYQDTAFGDEAPSLSTPYPIGGAVVADVAGVEAAVRMTYGRPDKGIVILGDTPDDRVETGGFYTDAEFTDVFTVPLVAGDAARPLTNPGSVVLTEPVAERAFGSAAAAVGASRRFVVSTDTLTLTVRAVVEAPPTQSSLQYGALLPMGAYLSRRPDISEAWQSPMFRTFALLAPGVSSGTAEATANRLSQAEIGGTEDDGVSYVALPLKDFHLSDLSYKQGFLGSAPLLRVFSAIALLILSLSVINYVNLATARAARRAREVGVRKVLGASRSELVAQFLRESALLTAVSAVGGVALAVVALPWFNETFGTALTLASLDPVFWVGLAVAALVVGVGAGLYPAFYLTRFSPSRVLSGSRSGGASGALTLGGARLRRGLVVLQFASAVALIALTGSVYRQLDYMRSKPLGFEPEALASVRVLDSALSTQTEALKAAFTSGPAVEAAAGVSSAPPGFTQRMTHAPDPAQPDLRLTYSPVVADVDLARVAGFEVAAGRWFDPTQPSDAATGVVVNETFARSLGYAPAEAVGKTLNVGRQDGQRVIGVLRDFHHASFREAILPVAFAPSRPLEGDPIESPPRYREILVRLIPGREAEGMRHLESAWDRFSPDAPINVARVQDEITALSEDEAALTRVFGLFAFIAVVIAVLGLAGLATYTAERRRREMGIRKALGASVSGLVGLLSREYLALALVAAVLATPVVVLVVRRWLEGFAFHQPFSPFVVVGATLLVLVLALLSVGVQAYRAASTDPTRVLRSE